VECGGGGESTKLLQPLQQISIPKVTGPLPIAIVKLSVSAGYTYLQHWYIPSNWLLLFQFRYLPSRVHISSKLCPYLDIRRQDISQKIWWCQTSTNQDNTHKTTTQDNSPKITTRHIIF